MQESSQGLVWGLEGPDELVVEGLLCQFLGQQEAITRF